MKEKALGKSFTTTESRTKYLLFLMSASKCGNFKRTQLQLLMNPLKSSSLNNYTLIKKISHTRFAHKLITFWYGKNLNNVQYIIFHQNKSKES